jgi:hypothetical protein
VSAINSPKSSRDQIAGMANLVARAEAMAAAVTVPAWAVFCVATVLGFWSLWVYSQADLTLAYGDAIAHLNTSRRMVDSATPSFSQLGSVWLPLPHVLMLPTIWNDTMWHTGLSGSIVSVLTFGLATAYVYKFIQALTEHGLAALLGAALFATNGNLLFMQATPMSESLMIFLVVGATYHLLRWAQAGSLLHFLLSAVFILGATMTRYEAWVLVPAGVAVVAVTSYHRRRSVSDLEGFSLAWGVLAGYGIFLWFLYNQVIFGSFMQFSSDPGAATSYASLAEADGLLPTKHDPFASVSVFGFAVIDNAGLPLVLAGIAGAALLMLSRVPLPVKLVAILPLSLLVFHVVSLTAGQSVMWNPHSSPNDFYNSRYGLLILPAVVLAASYLAAPRLRSMGLLVLAAVLLPQLLGLPLSPAGLRDTRERLASLEGYEFAGSWVDSNYPIARSDEQITVVEASIFDDGNIDPTADWIGDQAREGRILVSAQANRTAILMFRSGLPLSSFVTEGNKPYFDEELASPGRHTRWIIYQPDEAMDAVRPVVESGAPAGFEVVYEGDGFQVFHRSDQPTISSAPAEGSSP